MARAEGRQGEALLFNDRWFLTIGPMITASPELDELVRRTEGLQPWRRVFHAGNGIVVSLGPTAMGWDRWTTVGLLAGAFVLAVMVDLARLRVSAINRRFFHTFRSIASPREARGMASSTWYLLGAGIAYAAFPPLYASASIMVLGLADPAASVLGRLYGSIPLGKGSVQGATAFFVTTAVILSLFVGPDPLVLVVALGAALAEILPVGVDDNVTIPLATGGLLWLVLGTPL